MKVTTEILDKDSNVKVITVTVDEETAKILDSLENKQIRHEYILMLHEEKKQNRREREHCISLERLRKKKWNKVDESVDIEKQVLNMVEYERLTSCLTNEQKWLVDQRFILGKTQSQIARDLDVSFSSIRDRFRIIFEKIKEIL